MNTPELGGFRGRKPEIDGANWRWAGINAFYHENTRDRLCFQMVFPITRKYYERPTTAVGNAPRSQPVRPTVIITIIGKVH